MNPLRRHRAPSAGERLAPFRIVIAYTLLGTLLVFFNDPALHALGLDDEAHGPLRIAGGLVWVWATAALMFTLRRRRISADRRHESDLNARVNQLSCLYEVSRLLHLPGVLGEAALGSIARLVANAMPPLGRAEARVSLDGREAFTPGFRDREPMVRIPVVVRARVLGAVEVMFPEGPADGNGYRGFEEGTSLLEGVASQLALVGERQLAEREAMTHRERLAHMTRLSLLGEMAGGIAHEINQPLTAIASYAQACRRMIQSQCGEKPEVLDAMDQIGAQAFRGGEIIRRLRGFATRGERKRQPVELGGLLRDVVRLAEVDSRLHRIGIRLDLAEGIPLVLADPVQIQQVALNLIRNGLEAMDKVPPEKAAVIVRSRWRDDNMVEVTVEDRGEGVPAETERSLFLPFATTKTSGMGLGLSISHSIVTSHGGELWFTRNDGRPGTTFHFTIPAAPAGAVSKQDDGKEATT
jgi:C4-dicarboxylate-specific signal transduction histidine kinase